MQHGYMLTRRDAMVLYRTVKFQPLQALVLCRPCVPLLMHVSLLSSSLEGGGVVC